MSSQSETGHAKNVSNFKELITAVKGLGERYKPSNPGLSIAALEALAEQAKKAMDQLKEAEVLASKGTDELQESFKSLNTLSSRIIGMLNSSEAAVAIKEDARKIQQVITGGNIKGKKNEALSQEGEVLKTTRSQSRQSYDNRLDNFEALIVLLEKTTEYQPNESELTLAALKNKALEMQQLIEASDRLNNDRIDAANQRDELLYAPVSGLVDRAKAVKEYVKGAFEGVKSPEYQKISGIAFKNLKR